MSIKRTLVIFIVLLCEKSQAQTINKITGPLGVYDILRGYCYSDSLGTDSILIQDAFRFGEGGLTNQGFYFGVPFSAEIDSNAVYHFHRLYGIVQHRTEDGANNKPGDTALYTPFPQSDGPGMIQGAQRFSRLSQLYGSFCGIYMDDWNGDTVITRQVRDALQGKYVDAQGNVCADCVPATPYNKINAVIYDTGAIAGALSVIDGVVYSYIDKQNCCYTNLDSDISTLRRNFPKKEIVIATFLNNSHVGWEDPAGVSYMIRHSIDRYDDGYISGFTIFAEVFFNKNHISLSHWDSLGLQSLLDTAYYPYLGLGRGQIYDCQSGQPLTGAAVRAYCRGRISGDTMMRSYQMTDSEGSYQFGLWAGNRNTDSTYHWLIAEAPGYITDTFGFWIRRNDTTEIPRFALCPGINGTKANMVVYPNPTSGGMIVEVGAGPEIGSELDVYDLLGQKVYSTAQAAAETYLDLSAQADGIYIVSLRGSGLKSKVVLRH